MVDEIVDIAGIDYSTHYVDLVRIIEDGAPRWDRWELEGADSFDRCRTVGYMLPGAHSAYWDDVLAVGIEEPAGRNTGHLFRIQGAVLSQIPARMLVEKWMPSQWRKAVGLPGNCSKDVVEKWVVRERLDDVDPPSVGQIVTFPLWPQDACDAYCIALATQKALDRQAVPVLPSDEFGLEEQ